MKKKEGNVGGAPRQSPRVRPSGNLVVGPEGRERIFISRLSKTLGDKFTYQDMTDDLPEGWGDDHDGLYARLKSAGN